jgi:hypothetical protein
MPLEEKIHKKYPYWNRCKQNYNNLNLTSLKTDVGPES